MRFGNLAFSNTVLGFEIASYFGRFSSIMETLETIPQKGLDGTPLMEEEASFMAKMLYMRVAWTGCATWSEADGWHGDLLYGEQPAPSGEGEEPALEYVVADYHTTRADCRGNVIGVVLHAGTGPVGLAIITAQAPGAKIAAFARLVMSYYEYTTTGFQRPTDKEWESTCLSQATRPAWVSSFLANDAGEPY